MPFFVYGNDSKTGEPLKRIFSDAATEDAARIDAASRGMQATSIVACRDDQRPSESPPPLTQAGTASPASTVSPPPSVSSAQRNAIDGVARYMNIVAIVLSVIGVLQLLAAVVLRSFGSFIEAVVDLILGVLILGVAKKFRRVNEERGNDPRLLTEALESLASLYFFQVVVIGIAAAFVVIAVLVVFLKIKLLR